MYKIKYKSYQTDMALKVSFSYVYFNVYFHHTLSKNNNTVKITNNFDLTKYTPIHYFQYF